MGWVVICLKIPTFVVATTTVTLLAELNSGCDLLENSYLCGSNNNVSWLILPIRFVVICLKIPTFVVATTTLYCLFIRRFCCDLLENSYLCGSNNN